jgi:hypothetical protein
MKIASRLDWSLMILVVVILITSMLVTRADTSARSDSRASEAMAERGQGNKAEDPRQAPETKSDAAAKTIDDKALVKHSYRIFADYFQIYIWDERGTPLIDWKTEAYTRERVAVAPGVVGISTARNMSVPLEVEIRQSEPRDSHKAWDQVVDCAIHISSGRIVIAGTTDDPDTAPRISISPGNYKVRVFFAGLDKISANGLNGSDRYRVVFWPGELAPIRVLKQHPSR